MRLNGAAKNRAGAFFREIRHSGGIAPSNWILGADLVERIVLNSIAAI